MKIDISIPFIQVPVSKLEKILPEKSHIQKLKKMPPLGTYSNEEIYRRTISLSFEDNQLDGYIIRDWGRNDSFLGNQYFKVEELD